jgi:hypothetical protein
VRNGNRDTSGSHDLALLLGRDREAVPFHIELGSLQAKEFHSTAELEQSELLWSKKDNVMASHGVFLPLVVRLAMSLAQDCR